MKNAVVVIMDVPFEVVTVRRKILVGYLVKVNAAVHGKVYVLEKNPVQFV